MHLNLPKNFFAFLSKSIIFSVKQHLKCISFLLVWFHEPVKYHVEVISPIMNPTCNFKQLTHLASSSCSLFNSQLNFLNPLFSFESASLM